MKMITKILRILLPLATIVLAAIAINAQDVTHTALLAAMVSLLMMSTVLNMRAQRQEQEKQSAQQEEKQDEQH